MSSKQVEAIGYLEQMGHMLGMWGPTRDAPPDDPPTDYLLGVLAGMLAAPDNVPLVYAGGLMLEYYVPGWRNILEEGYGPFTERGDSQVAKWRRRVLQRDGCCQRCGTGANLHAHHIVPWATAPTLRLELSNGIALCSNCHAAEHEDIAELVRSTGYGG